ncbi:hypothetical protein HMPREF0322_04901 [Desulfitobacterium hafniense DP7]|uniref:Uncharacterized protein n=2 Tax=Desulfitobacterium hafniense TaxID=49338 RepID=A0A0W1JIQ2_DESHA|nr:hypothetical protein HMPREF0322_04901 [Desulfitobacterium hafniense DP7]KTE91459.1 hypothetical protein AT727_22320 [Desulfitobacterium hafniense]
MRLADESIAFFPEALCHEGIVCSKFLLSKHILDVIIKRTLQQKVLLIKRRIPEPCCIPFVFGK